MTTQTKRNEAAELLGYDLNRFLLMIQSELDASPDAAGELSITGTVRHMPTSNITWVQIKNTQNTTSWVAWSPAHAAHGENLIAADAPEDHPTSEYDAH